MQELYGDRSGSGLGQAQVFAMPYNARRWLTPGLVPIAPATPSLGNTNAYIRIPHASGPLRPASAGDSDADREKLREERVRRIVEFGDRYKEISLKAITGPTPDSVLASKTLSGLMVKAVEKSSPNQWVSFFLSAGLLNFRATYRCCSGLLEPFTVSCRKVFWTRFCRQEPRLIPKPSRLSTTATVAGRSTTIRKFARLLTHKTDS